MRPALEHPVHSVTEKIKKAARTGKSIRFTIAEVEVLLRDEIYQPIARLEAEEMRKACAREGDNDNSLGIIGSGSGPTAGPGASAGSNAAEMEAMSRGARLRLSEAISELKRPKTP